ncbi:MAG: hypothetical protein KJ957_03765 [Candidatus Omnitrophica bacterium]|nr:hypothetical protein [Candidatus Omnitrophota bacterium]
MNKLSVLLLPLILIGCATLSSDIKPGEMLFGEIVSLSDGNTLPMQIEIIKISDVNGKMSAYNPKTGEDFQGKYSAIFEKEIVDGFGSSTVTTDSGTRHGSRDKTTIKTSSTTEAAAVLIGDKGTVLDISMTMQTGNRKRDLHGHGKAKDNKGNKYQVRF